MKKRCVKLIVFAYLFSLILLIISFIYDKNIIEFITSNRIEFLSYFFTYLGYVTEWPILFFVTLLFLYYKKRDLLKRFVFVYSLTLIIILILRLLTRIDRPDVSYLEIDFLAFKYSFPSGHATTIFLLLPLFISLYPRKKYIFVISAFIMALSRLYIGVHYLSDIIFGALLGYSLSYLLFIECKNKKSDKNKKLNKKF
ncbi:MAG: phosphatase PAP2 family protein [archaeon]